MAAYCLICDSTAVLYKETTTTVVALIGTLESFFLGMQDVRAGQPDAERTGYLRQALARINQAVSRATSDYLVTMAFAQDVQKYQFRHHKYLCLRCGALFDQGPTISSSTVPPSAQTNSITICRSS